MICAFFSMRLIIAQLFFLILQNKRVNKCTISLGTPLAKVAMTMRDFQALREKSDIRGEV